MTLRRFPWKLPRLSDNSYKLFASAPTPGTVPAESRPKSTSDLPAAAEDARRKPGPRPETQSDPVSHTSQHHHHHRHRSDATEPELAESSANAASASGTRSDAPNVKPEVLKGPWRLLRLLPRETRSIIGRMLEVDPMQRATVSDMLEDQWITTTPVCRQAEGTGEVYRAEAHRHTLEPGTAATPVPSQK
jgi:serine/threonine protein kinase